MVKVGDSVRLAYIWDCHPKNGEVGKVVCVHPYKFYPNGDPEECVMKIEYEILYEDGTTFCIDDDESENSGVSSPLEIIEA